MRTTKLMLVFIALMFRTAHFVHGDERTPLESRLAADSLWARAVFAPIDDSEYRLKWALMATLAHKDHPGIQSQILLFIGNTKLFSFSEEMIDDPSSSVRVLIQNPGKSIELLSGTTCGSSTELALLAFDDVLRHLTPEEVLFVGEIAKAEGIDTACLAMATCFEGTHEVAAQLGYLASRDLGLKLFSVRLEQMASENGISCLFAASYYASIGERDASLKLLAVSASKRLMVWPRVPPPPPTRITVAVTPFSEDSGIAGQAASWPWNESVLMRENMHIGADSRITSLFKRTFNHNAGEMCKSDGLLHTIGLRCLTGSEASSSLVLLGMALCRKTSSILKRCEGGDVLLDAEDKFYKQLSQDDELRQFTLTMGAEWCRRGESPRKAESEIFMRLSASLRELSTSQIYSQLCEMEDCR